MDLVTTAIVCNCAISIGCLVATISIVRFRRQVVALRDCCDRWTIDCDLLTDAPMSFYTNASRINSFRHIYQQQSVTLEKLRAFGLLVGMSRSILLKRRLT
jgi:hypothetical protein